MLSVAHFIRVGTYSLDNRTSSGVLGTYQLPVLVGLDRQEPFIGSWWKKCSTLWDSNLLPLSTSFKQQPCRRWRKSRWILYVVGLLITLGHFSDLLWQHNGERLRWHNRERLCLCKDEGLRVIAGDVVEVHAIGEDYLVRHCY